MSDRGTAPTSEQMGGIGGNIMRALPNALEQLAQEGILPNKVSSYSQNGAFLSKALAACFRMMSNGHAGVVVAEATDDRSIFVDVNGLLLPGAELPLPEGSLRCHVYVDGTRTPQQAVDATGRRQDVDKDVLATLPPSESGEMDVYFIPGMRTLSVSEAKAFLAPYGLVYNPRAQAAGNEADPVFADKHPNATLWGNNCCLAFGRWLGGGRDVGCDRLGLDWFGDWWFAGVPFSRK